MGVCTVTKVFRPDRDDNGRFQKDPLAVVHSGSMYSDLWFNGKLLLRTEMREIDILNILQNCPSACKYNQHKADNKI